MFGFPDKATVNRLREQYLADTRVELVNMDDPYSKLTPGDRGTVRFVDDAGNIHVAWDCGSSLAVAYGDDSCRKLTEQELAEEQENNYESDNDDELEM